jgi:hypothetical protein
VCVCMSRKERAMRTLVGDVIGQRRGVGGAVNWSDDEDEH